MTVRSNVTAPRAPGRAARRLAARVCALLSGGLAVLGVAWLGGCAVQTPIVPYPTVVYAPHPLRLPAEPPATEGAAQARAETLLETYSASPNRDPDGLGVLDSIWLNSRMTLVTWPVAQAREAQNRIAFARGDAEQAKHLREAEALYGGHWVFEGLLLGDLGVTVRLEWYLPEGIYLVDDRGRKFLPQAAQDAHPLTTSRDPHPLTATVERSRFGEARYTYPRLIFPAEAITAETRAVSLYFAALSKRLRFTWVFDPDYELPAAAPDAGREQNRLFPPN